MVISGMKGGIYMQNLQKIAILVEDLYEDQELWYPYYRLKEAGYDIKIVGPEKRTYYSKHQYPTSVDLSIAEVKIEEFIGVIIPGGYAPDHIRRSQKMVNFVRKIFEKDGLVAAICHAPWVLISAGVVNEKDATCFFSIKDDLINAGANYLDQEVVVDHHLVTSRSPKDLPAYLPAILSVLKDLK
jgi:protease I